MMQRPEFFQAVKIVVSAATNSRLQDSRDGVAAPAVRRLEISRIRSHTDRSLTYASEIAPSSGRQQPKRGKTGAP
jgi:hypothetical protein